MRVGSTTGSFSLSSKFGNEIDGFLLDVRERFFGDLRKPRFGVTHGRRRVAIHRTVVALAIHERIAHVEILREADERVVDGRIAVRVVFAEHLADDLGAFAVGLRGGEAELVHAEEDTAMDGLQAVAHIGKRAPDDYAHGVIEVRLLHLRFDINRRHDRLILFVRHSCLVEWFLGNRKFPRAIFVAVRELPSTVF